jgi:patatin-like phospholipase/acyl hydrolase
MSHRILSLDGGGAWAIIEVRALIDLYGIDTAEHDVLRRFDLVAANSGGSLVLAGLVENKTLGQILDLFETEANRRMIFSPTKNLPDRTLQLLIGIGIAGATCGWPTTALTSRSLWTAKR